MAEHSRRKAARKLLSKSGYRTGGHFTAKEDESQDRKMIAAALKKDEAKDKAMIREAINEHDDQLHGGKKTRLKLKDGGMAMGMEPKSRGDRKSRGKKPGKTIVNVVVGAEKPNAPMPAPMMAPHPMMPPPAGVPAPMPPHPMMPPMAGRPPMPGMPPQMAKKGGKVDSMRDPVKALEPFGGTRLKAGGRARKVLKDYPIDDGAGGGMGRLEKAEAYGAKSAR